MDVIFSVWPIMMLLVQLLFQSVVSPSVPFSCYPQSCPFWSFVFGWPLFLGKGPLFLWTGCSFRDMLDWEEPLAAAGGRCLGKGPNCLTYQAGSSKDLYHIVSPSLPPCGGWIEASAKLSRHTFPGCSSSHPGNPVLPGHLEHTQSARMAFQLSHTGVEIHKILVGSSFFYCRLMCKHLSGFGACTGRSRSWILCV